MIRSGVQRLVENLFSILSTKQYSCAVTKNFVDITHYALVVLDGEKYFFCMEMFERKWEASWQISRGAI